MVYDAASSRNNKTPKEHALENSGIGSSIDTIIIEKHCLLSCNKGVSNELPLSSLPGIIDTGHTNMRTTKKKKEIVRAVSHPSARHWSCSERLFLSYKYLVIGRAAPKVPYRQL